MWPVAPFTAVTGGLWLPNSSTSANASARSFATVEVPWAFTWLTSRRATLASARANCMQRRAPSPSGLGATKWCASAHAP
jgi:hypothetical protein